jgi:hypothetical protein
MEDRLQKGCVMLNRFLMGGLPLAACSLCLQGQAPHLLKPIAYGFDLPVVIEWQSVPAGIYTVEYSVGLNGDWQPIVEGFPSQGTTTRFGDFGSPGLDRFRFASGDVDAPYRFYRVKLERLMDMTQPITVTVNNLPDGSVLSGSIQVQGSVSAVQGVIAVKLLVDGHVVSRARGPSFTLPCETRYFANGAHRLSVMAEDVGGLESTEEPNSLTSRGPSYGARNVAVTFNNALSGVRLRYEHFRPDLGQTQEIGAYWSTPRLWRVDAATVDGSFVYRSFSGSGQRVLITWDGKNSAGVSLDPQIVTYLFHDLGPAAQTPPNPPPGGGGPPSPLGASSDSGQQENHKKPRPDPPLPPWPLDPSTWPGTGSQVESAPSPRTTVIVDSADSGTALLGPLDAGDAAFQTSQPIFYLGTATIMAQGHHPLLDPFGRYLPPPRLIGGRVRMASRSEYGPWGGLKRVKGIVNECADEMARMGYSVLYKKLDDDVLPQHIVAGAENLFNRANIGLYLGHSLAAKDAEQGFIWKQSYVPIYNSATDTMSWPGTSDMYFGSDYLKWMAFFSCNMFRDEGYRPDGLYGQMKNFFALPLNGRLHILQGYATEMSMHPDFAALWTIALRGSPLVSSANHSVIGAWNYACRNTQPAGSPTDPVNVARSIFWPECQGDYLYGYGPQTEPDIADPDDPTEQANLLEQDEAANAPEP